MNIDGDNFNQPFEEGYCRPSQQVSQSWVNGKVVLKRYTLIILYPIKRKSKQATIEYNGQVYKTDPVKITVTAAVATERP
jgi:hypothetical protein